MTLSKLSRPIPKALLPHTATLKIPRGEGIFRDGEYEEKTLYNVRVQMNEKFRQNKSAEHRTKGAIMYFDSVNSKPEDIKFEPEQLVDFYGEVFKIEAVKAVLAGEKIHHYRVEML